MVEVRKLAVELNLNRSALLKRLKKMGIVPIKVNRQTGRTVQPINLISDDEANRARSLYIRANQPV